MSFVKVRGLPLLLLRFAISHALVAGRRPVIIPTGPIEIRLICARRATHMDGLALKVSLPVTGTATDTATESVLFTIDTGANVTTMEPELYDLLADSTTRDRTGMVAVPRDTLSALCTSA